MAPNDILCVICAAQGEEDCVLCDECREAYHPKCVGADDSVRSREWFCPKCAARSSQKETGLPTTSFPSGDNPGSSTPTHQRDMMQEISLLFDQMKARMEKSSESPQTPQVRTRCYACEKTDAGNKILCNPCGRWCHISCLSEDEAASIASWKCALCTVARMRASTNVMDRLVDRLERLEQKMVVSAMDPRPSYGIPPPSSTVFGRSAETSQELSQSQASARHTGASKLPPFSGNPEEWDMFISAYEETTRLCGFTDGENIIRLQQALKGQALKAVQLRLRKAENLEEVLDTLRSSYGRPELIVNTLLDQIKNAPVPRMEKLDTLVSYALMVEEISAAVRTGGLENRYDGPLLEELVGRLPPIIAFLWGMQRLGKPLASLSDFGTWMKSAKEAALIASPAAAKTDDRRRARNINVHIPAERTAQHEPDKCACDHRCNQLEYCEAFLQLTPNDRWKLVKGEHLCSICLRRHRTTCRITRSCNKNGCTKRHHPLLHSPPSPEGQNGTSIMSSTKRITMPRRTQEFEISAPQSSVKKSQARVSRIAQPVRKSSKQSGIGQFGENGRSRSVERGLNALAGLPSTAVKKSLNPPRSSSATPQLRTPHRSVFHHGGLNAENIPSFSIPSTVERERCTVEARPIFDYLAQANVPDLPKEFIERGNIKTMSMKQFLIIVAHLLRQIGGHRYKIGTNFIEDIIKAITELQCPFTVSKSMLKTPSAPHSIQQVVTMLTWLIQLAPVPVTDWAPNYQHVAEFPTPEYTQFFFQSATESFHLWNLKREEEFEAQVERMVDRLVAAKTGGLSQEQVRQRTEQIRQQLEAISVDRSNGQMREQSFDEVQREVVEKQRIVKQLTEETKQLDRQFERQQQEYYLRQDQYYDWESAIQRVKEQLARQQMTAKERDELQAEIAHDRNVVAAKRNAIACLDGESSDYQITLSRLIKQKINLISELNTKLYNFSNAIKPDIEFTPIELSLTCSNYPELERTLRALEQQLTAVFAEYQALQQRLSQQKMRLEQQVSDEQLTIEPLETKIAKQTERLQQLQQRRETVVRELVALGERANERGTLEQRTKELDQRIEQAMEQMASNRKAIVKLTYDKQQLMEDGLERCRQALEERHQKLADLREQVDGCEAIMKQIVNVCAKSNEEEPPC